MSRPLTRNGVPLRLFTPEEDALMLRAIQQGVPRGSVQRLAREMRRPHGSVSVRLRDLRSAMAEPVPKAATVPAIGPVRTAARVPVAADQAPPWTPGELDVLRPYAAMARIPQGAAFKLAQRLGRTDDAVRWRISWLRHQPAPPAEQERNGAEGSVSASVPRVVPSAAAPVSGRGLDVSSLTLVAAVEARVAPCAVSPPAGAAPPGCAPAVPSAGLVWARETLARGVGLDKLLRTAGDRLGWRERDALRREAA